MKVYLKNILLSRIPLVLALSLVFLVAAAVSNNTTPFIVDSFQDGVLIKVPRDGLFIVYNIGILVLAIIATLVEFSFKMNRLLSSQVYAFPIKREKVFKARYISGLIECVVPFTIAYFLSMISVVSSKNMYDIHGILIYYPCGLVAVILLYSYCSFIFCKANNMVDGIASIGLSIATPLVLGFAIQDLVNSFIKNVVKFSYFSPTYILDFPTKISNGILLKTQYNVSFIDIIFVVIWFVILVLTIVFKDYYNKRIKSEDIVNESDSIYCYKVFLPVASISLSIVLSFLISFWAIVLVPVFTVSGYVLYGRNGSFEGKNYAIPILVVESVVIILVSSLVMGGVL